MTNFDFTVDRRQTNSEKWDAIAVRYQEDGLLPLWVADMDFPSPPCVLEAFQRFLQKPVLGYSTFPDSLYTAIIEWQRKRHNFTVTQEEILFSGGVVPSIATAIQAYTAVGDTVMIHDPVYPPFTSTVLNNQRKLVTSRLLIENGRYQMDFADMEQKMAAESVKLFVLCNPHNPGGRVWSAEELAQLGRLCQKYGVLVVSDEIHQDLIFAPHTFTTFQNAADPAGDFSIILTAATKTFNLAGIKNSMIFIKNQQLRQQFTTKQKQNCSYEINTFGLVGTEAAYRDGEQWLEELLAYLQNNLLTAQEYFDQHLPQIKVMQPEGTYLLWLDCKAYGFSDKELEERLIHRGKVVLNSGITFGASGSGCLRMNLAAPNATIAEGLQRISTALA